MREIVLLTRSHVAFPIDDRLRVSLNQLDGIGITRESSQRVRAWHRAAFSATRRGRIAASGCRGDAWALGARLAGFGLRLAEDKTRLIEFPLRPSHDSGAASGGPRPFAFIGFTHYCGRTRDGRFIVKHKTEGKRLSRKLKALRQEVWRFVHAPQATQHEWFTAVLRGHYGYYGRPHNYPALNGFYREVRRTWLGCLRRRSQKSRRMGWPEFETLTARFRLPAPRITRTGRRRGYDAGYSREEPGAGKPPARICEGKSRMAELLDHDPSPHHARLGLSTTALLPRTSRKAISYGTGRSGEALQANNCHPPARRDLHQADPPNDGRVFKVPQCGTLADAGSSARQCAAPPPPSSGKP